MPLDLFADEEKKPLDLFADEPKAPKSDISKGPIIDTGKSLETVKNVGKVYPALETAANLATSLYGVPISGLAGIGGMLASGMTRGASLDERLKTGSDVQKWVAGKLIYEPKTAGGKQLTEATTYPLQKVEEAGGYLGGKLEQAGYPNTGALVHSAVQASPLLLGVRRSPQAKAAKVESRLNASIDKGIEKSIRPGVEGKRTNPQVEKYMGNARTAVKTIAENRERLNLTDEYGQLTGKLPQNLKQFSQAIDQSKKSVFEEYDAMAKAATGTDVTIDLSTIVKELKTVASNKTVKDFNPQFSDYAFDLSERLKERKRYTAAEAQDVIATINKRLDAFYKNPTYENASKASIDSMVANNIRKSLDSIIEESVGPGYQKLKYKYGSLKAIERDVNRRSIVDARKNTKGLIDFSDIFSGSQVVGGILSLNPAQVAVGATAKSIASIIKYMNNPNRIVKNMFSEVEKAVPVRERQIIQANPKALAAIKTGELQPGGSLVLPNRIDTEAGKQVPFIPRAPEKAEPYSYGKENWKVTQIKDTGVDKTTKWKMNLSDEYRSAITGLYNEVLEGQQGSRYMVKDPNGPGVEWFGEHSTFPTWMKNEGWTKKEVLQALENAQNNKPLGVQQAQIVQKALEFLDNQEYDYHVKGAINEGISKDEIKLAEADAAKTFAQETADDFRDFLRKIKEGTADEGSIADFKEFLAKIDLKLEDLPEPTAKTIKTSEAPF